MQMLDQFEGRLLEIPRAGEPPHAVQYSWIVPAGR